MHSKQSSALRAAFPLTLPVMAGYLVLGMGFGILLQSKGYHFGWAILMSLTIYAGSMQYVAVDLLSGGATLVATALMTLMVNARHLFYGISMLDKYRTLGRKRWMMIFELTDETYSIVCSHEPPEGVDRDGFFWPSPCWISPTGSWAARLAPFWAQWFPLTSPAWTSP